MPSHFQQTYILVHGAWHGAWCWYKLAPLLRRQGHRVVAVDLPGHGRDRTPIKDISLDSYVDVVEHWLKKEEAPAIVVGHSMGGIVISQLAERYPDKIANLIYLAAYLIPNGQAMSQVARSDEDSLLIHNFERNEQEGTYVPKQSVIKAALYDDCDENDVELARCLITPEPMAPQRTPLSLTDANFGRVPRIYIETLNDKAISNAVQTMMYESIRCEKVFSLRSGHSPFLSAPEELASILLSGL
jgi:pimeloyl-ACP methyl ester carboxylesterase